MSTNPYTTHSHHLAYPMHIIISGAASGIGLAQAKKFLEAGHYITGIDLQRTKATDELFDQFDEQLTYLQLDVSDALAVENQLAPYLKQHSLGVDVLCNTAGELDGFHPMQEVSLDEWMKIIQTNLTSQFILTQCCLPYLLKKSASRVINMASIAGLTAGGGSVAYTASKHGVIGFTKQLAYDYAYTGLRVNAIAPGAVATAMTQQDFIGDPSMADWVKEQTPTKRWATPDDIAGLTLFLASDASEYMTGTVIPVDGGWLIR